MQKKTSEMKQGHFTLGHPVEYSKYMYYVYMYILSYVYIYETTDILFTHIT